MIKEADRITNLALDYIRKKENIVSKADEASNKNIKTVHDMVDVIYLKTPSITQFACFIIKNMYCNKDFPLFELLKKSPFSKEILDEFEKINNNSDKIANTINKIPIILNHLNTLSKNTTSLQFFKPNDILSILLEDLKNISIQLGSFIKNPENFDQSKIDVIQKKLFLKIMNYCNSILGSNRLDQLNTLNQLFIDEFKFPLSDKLSSLNKDSSGIIIDSTCEKIFSEFQQIITAKSTSVIKQPEMKKK